MTAAALSHKQRRIINYVALFFAFIIDFEYTIFNRRLCIRSVTRHDSENAHALVIIYRTLHINVFDSRVAADYSKKSRHVHIRKADIFYGSRIKRGEYRTRRKIGSALYLVCCLNSVNYMALAVENTRKAETPTVYSRIFAAVPCMQRQHFIDMSGFNVFIQTIISVGIGFFIHHVYTNFIHKGLKLVFVGNNSVPNAEVYGIAAIVIRINHCLVFARIKRRERIGSI